MPRPVLFSTLLVLAAELADRHEAAEQPWQRRYIVLDPGTSLQALGMDLEIIGHRRRGPGRNLGRRRFRTAPGYGWGGPHWRFSQRRYWFEPLPLYVIFERLHEGGYRPVTSIALRGDRYIITACDRFDRPVRLILDARTGRVLARVLGAGRLLDG